MTTIGKRICLNLFVAFFFAISAAAFAEMQVGMYGFVKLDVLQVNRLTGNFPEIFPFNVPLSNNPADHHSQTILDARNSRFGVLATDELWGIKMRGAIEGDFFDAAGDAISFNSREFRLRLAYAKAEIPNGVFFVFGQYWTLIMNIPDIEAPWTVNTNVTPVGESIARQPQARFGYKHTVCGLGDIQLEGSAEKHAFNDLGFTTPSGSDPAQGCEQRWPLLAVKASWLSEKFKCSLGAAGTQCNYVLNDAGTLLNQYVWTIIGIASYKWNHLTLWGTANHTVGLNSLYSGFFANMALTRANRFLPFKSNGGAAALRYDWIDSVLFSDVIYGIQIGERIPHFRFTGDGLKTMKDFHLNIFYRFWEKWLVGLEYQAIFVKAFNGKTGNANAIHFGAWYTFGDLPKGAH